MYLTDDAPWANVARLAVERGTEVRLVWSASPDDEYYEAASYSNPGHWHPMTYQASANGIRVECACEAHVNGRPCHHLAALLLVQRMIPAPATSEPAAKPAVEPTAEYKRLRGRAALALINSDFDEHDALKAKLATMGAGR